VPAPLSQSEFGVSSRHSLNTTVQMDDSLDEGGEEVSHFRMEQQEVSSGCHSFAMQAVAASQSEFGVCSRHPLNTIAWTSGFRPDGR
jgi:hypothetical protein